MVFAAFKKFGCFVTVLGMVVEASASVADGDFDPRFGVVDAVSGLSVLRRRPCLTSSMADALSLLYL